MKVVILGAGPTGLGAAWRLSELSYTNFQILEKEKYVGGLSASFLDKKGFTWDIGGHVIHSHFPYFDKVIKASLGKSTYAHQRKTFAYVQNRLIPYPFQKNIHKLPLVPFLECFIGLLKTSKSQNNHDFQTYIKKTFGPGVSKYFMVPYNEKVWNFPLSQMSTSWLGERVSPTTAKEIVLNFLLGKSSTDWGPNSKFTYPSQGTGQLWQKIAAIIGKEFIKLQSEIIEIDFEKKKLFTKNGSQTYDALISSIPLDLLIANARNKPKWLTGSVKNLAHNSVHLTGIGIKKIQKDKKSWIYFPQKDIPFYRINFLSAYSPKMTPGPNFQSILTETTTNSEVDSEKIIDSLVKTNVLTKEDRSKISSIWTKKLPYAYPIPTRYRDQSLFKIQKYLESKSVFSRGRFGAWKYEVSNMDHSFMQGVEVVNRIVSNKPETVWTL